MENGCLGKTALGRKNCSIPPQKLCVKPRVRATARVGCCGYAEINGVLAADASSGMALGEELQLT